MHLTRTGATSACPSTYTVVVEAYLDDTWFARICGLEESKRIVAHGRPATIITASVADQAALRGLLSTLWDMNLTILAVARRESE